jgi:digeranylgeranylglycerophospholipid reductase
MPSTSIHETFDILVIGAGPAGSAAAAAAAREGVSVLLLEEHEKIGVPLQCAEGLSRSTIKGWLDIKPEWVAVELRGSIVRGPDDDEFRIEYPGVGWIMDRKVFDPALVDIARRAGAVLKRSCRADGIEGDAVRVEETGEFKKYRFRQLIAADGIASRIGAGLGIDTRLNLDEIEVCAQYMLENIRLVPGYTTLIFGNRYAPGGYAWIFPKSAAAANVGLGIAPRKTEKKAVAFLDDWVKREFPAARIREKIFGGVPAQVLKKFSGKNFFLVGDAARLTDPLSGAGIANAVKSGMIAGRNAVQRLRGRKDHFEAEIKKEVLDEVKFHHRVRRAYLKLTDDDHRKIFEMGKKFFCGRTVNNINTRELVGQALKSLPHLLRLGIKLI